MQVKEIMRPIIQVEKDISLSEAAKIMSEKEIGSLVYSKEGKILGIITAKDLIKNFGKNEKISKIASSPVLTINKETQIEDAIRIMKEKKIKRLPIVENEKAIGIISVTDIAKNLEEVEEDFFF